MAARSVRKTKLGANRPFGPIHCSTYFMKTDTPRTDSVRKAYSANDTPGTPYGIWSLAEQLEKDWNKACDEQRWLMLEVDSWRYRAEAATGVLSRWMEWARAHGHLEHAAGIAADTRDILSNIGIDKTNSPPENE